MKLIPKSSDVYDRYRSSKLVAAGLKRREQLTHAARCDVCDAFNVLSCSRCADAVTVHIHDYVYLSIILRSSACTFSANLAIVVRNVTSHNK